MNKSLIICDRWMYGALLAMIFFLPYSFALIAISQGMMFTAWGLKSLLQFKSGSRRPQGFNFSSSMGWALIAIALLIILTVPFSHYPAVSLKKFFTRFLQQIFLMYLVTQIVHSRKRLYGVLSVLLLTSFLVCVDVMIQYTWGKDIVHHSPLLGRVSGPMNGPNDLGTLLVTVLPVVLTLIIICRRWMPAFPVSSKPLGGRMFWTGILALLFLLLVNVLGATGSRGAWVSFAVSMLALGLCLKRPKSTVLIILMLAVLTIHSLTSRRTDLSHAPVTYGSALGLFFDPSGRGSYWGTAVNVIRHYPWFGCGYCSYMKTLEDLQVGHEEYPHNSLLHITAELGLAGLILYIWLFVGLCLQIKNVLRAVSHERDLFLLGTGISCGILAWLIHSLLDTPWSSLQLGLLLWLMIGILLSLGFVVPNRGEKTCL